MVKAFTGRTSCTSIEDLRRGVQRQNRFLKLGESGIETVEYGWSGKYG